MEPLVLLRVVEEVSLLADAAAPTTITQRAFDDARVLPGAPARVPPAKQVTEELGKPWGEVLTIAHAPENKRSRLLGSKDKEPEQDWLTDEYAAYVLGTVARRLGKDTVTPGDYRVERERMLADDRRRWLHGAKRLLPNDDQIRTACGSWDAALVLAGLKRGPGLGGHKRRRVPTLVDLLERCHTAHGTLPTQRELEAFAAHGLDVPFPTMKGKKWSVAVADWRAQRAARGLTSPDALPPRAERPDYTLKVDGALPGERRQLPRTREECVDAVERYVAQLPRDAKGRPGKATKRGYDDWAREQGGTPRASIFDDHNGWSSVLTDATTTEGGSQAIPRAFG
jgi:hypothetical protein